MIKALNDIFIKFSDKIFLIDSRNKNDKFFNAYFKINASEAARLCGVNAEISESISLEELKQYTRQIFMKTNKTVFVSRGSRGIVIFDGEVFTEIPGILITKKIDTVGAGDTLASSITASISSGTSFLEAAEVANLAAGVTVQKIQVTGTASPQEILDIFTNVDYVYRPELADDFRFSRYYEDTEIEIVNTELIKGKIEHVVFDHDGTISTLRQGWESIMEPVMVRSILGKQYSSVNEETYQRVKKRVKEYIDQSTGIETIVQMHSLVDIIEEFGIVPKEEILKPSEYKEIYNSELMNRVNFRLKKLSVNELDVQDFTLKGIIKFLELLKNHNIKMYLASGTDVDDVLREAESLGYAHYFGEHIYGSLGDVTKNAKRIVIENIINKNKLSGPQLAGIGDGPVEIREVKKRGGITIGIASDEIRRYGISLSKRSRLIKAGADIIIPDFSQYNKLFNLIFISDKINKDKLTKRVMNY
jgi:phosphoglycolate phosphatase-like HAD superfamily hydrolase